MRIGAVGMVTPVGLSAHASCAAMRAAVSRFQELPVSYPAGPPLIGAYVPTWARPGMTRLVGLLARAVRECVGMDAKDLGTVPLLVGVSERDRPGRPPALDKGMIDAVGKRLGRPFHPQLSAVFPEGRAAVLRALGAARSLLASGQVKRCIVAGVDSFIDVPPLSWLVRERRMKMEDNPDGLIPGEAAAAVEVLPADPPPAATGVAAGGPAVTVSGLGFAEEKSTVSSGEPNLATGLTAAVKQALGEAGATLFDMDFRLSDVNGEQYYFRETSNVVSRLLRQHKEGFPIWHPADCIGDTGAASGAVLLGLGAVSFRRGYSHGPRAICQTASDAGTRAAAVLEAVAS